MSDTPEIRIGHADRNAALDKLGTHFADGYLNLGEFEDRTARVADANTRSELDALFADLPQATEIARVDPEALELEQKLRRKKLIDGITIALWVATVIPAFLALQAGSLWGALATPAVVLAVTFALNARAGLNGKEWEALEAIQQERDEERAARLRVAEKRRKELSGQ